MVINAVATKAQTILRGNAKHSGITVRRERFDFDKATMSQYFVKNNPMLTYMFLGLSSTFPTGEQFFVHTVRNVRDRVKNQQLQHDISAFIGQESMHSHAHEEFNDAAKHLGGGIQQLIGKIIQEEIAALDTAKRNLTEKQQLAVTCALEHFTAIMAKYFMENERFYHEMDPKVARLWFWHAIEESEHKAVAFDVYQEVFNDQTTRKRIMFIVTMSFMWRIVELTVRLMLQDKKSWSQWRKHLHAINEMKHIVTSLRADYIRYYQDDFHPNDDDTTRLVAKWYDLLGFEKAV